MLSQKTIIRLTGLFAVIFWTVLTIIDLHLLFWEANNLQAALPKYFGHLALFLFVASLIGYYKYSIGKAESINFIDLLWKTFVTGLVTTIISLAIKFLLLFVEGTKLSQNLIFVNFLYEVNLALIFVFISTAWIIWKRLILYQKTKWVNQLWNFYEWSVYATLLITILGLEPFNTFFIALYVVLFLVGLVLAVNLKWVAYLNFGQKWKAILFIVLIIIYLIYFVQNFQRFGEGYTIFRNLFNNLFFLSTISFILLYSIFSVLVILFNLPTSSVFEQKLEEALTFQKLSKAIPSGQDEEQVYEVLLNSATNSVNADASWIKIKNKNKGHLFLTKNLNKNSIDQIVELVHDSKSVVLAKRSFSNLTTSEVETVKIKKGPFRSAIVFPIEMEKEKVGELVLLKEVSEGFTREMGQIIMAFVNQASITIENYRLIQAALENERYREELKIAKKVQQSLLPTKLYVGEELELLAFTEAAAEVGGDYYDIHKRSDGKIALIIADVSGKGTSAAFNMSQMKGVFHSLMQLNIDVGEFLVLANAALSTCLERASFITATFFLIDPTERKISLARAGHCPSLFYSSYDKRAYYFENKGLGLGILRNGDYQNYVEKREVSYKSGDILTLYTDGIVESRNSKGEEFGYDRLRKLICEYGSYELKELKKRMIEEFYTFCGENKPDDDYTFLLIRLN